APLAQGFPAVCVFVNDQVDSHTIAALASNGVKLIALRCAGFNNVDLAACRERGIKVVRVPAYSPYAVAEHTIGMMLTLNRKFHRAFNRVREGNFALDGLMGFDLHGRTAGVIGTGKIGEIVTNLLAAFGCKLLAYDVAKNPNVEKHAQYVPLDELFAQSDIITLHCPLNAQTKHLINRETVSRMKRGVMIVNTSRGGLVDTRAATAGLKSGQIGYLGLDVYEEEAETFFEDGSETGVLDDVLARLLTFPNVLVTGHQGFFTSDAVKNISSTTLENLDAFERGEKLTNEVKS
ncbi:MAG TPA: 2-hydroxyacid dehydrogenase, partial [Pirellulales bacterium]